MGKTDKARQRAYRKRMVEKGYRQLALWLDEDTRTALNDLNPSDTDLSTVVSKAIKHYHASRNRKTVSSDVTKNVSSNRKKVSSDVTSSVASNRYMSPKLEDYILELRQSGMKLAEVAHRLFSEGYRNAKGEPYSTGTISKAETRAKRRNSPA